MHDWNAGDYENKAGFVAELGAPLVAILAPKAGEDILDLGCGTGVLAQRIAASGARVLAVDRSPAMLEKARALGLATQQADGQQLPFVARFDAVFSNAALHWMPDQHAVARGVFRALRPGGRYVGECGGFLNVAAIHTALRAVLLQHGHDPAVVDSHIYPTAAEFRALHEEQGFVAVEAELHNRDTVLPAGIRGWLEAFRHSFLAGAGVPEERQHAMIDAIEALLEPVLKDRAGVWHADYVRLRWRMRKPG